MQQVPYWGPTIPEWPVNPTATCLFLLDVRKQVHAFVHKEITTKIIMLETLGATVQDLVDRATPLAWNLCTPGILMLTTNVKLALSSYERI
jgi:hypothetical protein